MDELYFKMNTKALTYSSISDILANNHSYLSIESYEKIENHERYPDEISLKTKYMTASIDTYETNDCMLESPYSYDAPEFGVVDFEVYPYLFISMNYFLGREEVIDILELFKFLSLFMNIDKSDCILTSPSYDIIFFRKDNTFYFPDNPSLNDDLLPNWSDIKDNLKT